VERPAVATAGTLSVLRSYLSGWLSDRTHRRKIFVIMATLISSFNLFLMAIVICGSGFGMYSA
jgi:MFS family permease